ncbi:ABC transporter ATP-binding protein [Chlorogloea sp. CCALA 695]|uniref:ABC transporter ATP-binding protein n=1 Tax=Chlorogloea sp. CCALA 695 TaxID=2107693 RepID=UPI000D059A31|nr:ABC transporter ATP-binding protein [Chlorogloea sp. CCALA 695]PSB32755.1 ABC transporter ATP-binding protein [Chlorogloea sp. CCALA 695]
MSDTVIRVENLSKKYILGQQKQEHYATLRDVLASTAKSISRQALNPFAKKAPLPDLEEFWALKDVSFEIKQGDRVGFIGRNGAGKSTLLKVLSRITEPTTGRISIKGRIASLLEVGTGFHPELTGRENIYLNGSILGMSKFEIKKKFDEIVAFAEVEKFLDTPVKRYSSGMYVRLAFAVAAHLEPEILIIDEVLAVGDTQFQKKCLGKMEEVGKEGRTVLFVSHQMGMITQLCTKALMLNKGSVVQEGNAEHIISFYIKTIGLGEENNFVRAELLETEKSVFVSEAKTINASGLSTGVFTHNEPIYLEIIYKIKKNLNDVLLGIAVKDKIGRKVFTSQTALKQPESLDYNKNTFVATLKIPDTFLTPGQYSFLIAMHIPKIQVVDQLDNVCSFTITDIGSEFSMYEGLDYGCVFANCGWSIQQL